LKEHGPPMKVETKKNATRSEEEEEDSEVSVRNQAH
jgi:hypothetical protein